MQANKEQASEDDLKVQANTSPDPRVAEIVKILSTPLTLPEEVEPSSSSACSSVISVPSVLPSVNKPGLSLKERPITPTGAARQLLNEFDPNSAPSSISSVSSVNHNERAGLWKELALWAAESDWLSNLVTAVILLNTITLALYFPRASDGYKLGLDVCNYVWTAVFIVEFCIKVRVLSVYSTIMD